MKVITPKQLPTTLPILSTVTLWLLLDRLRPPEWVWGAAVVLAVIYWDISIYLICVEQHTNIWED